MKKFKTKLKLLRNVLIIIIVIFIIVVGRKAIILANLFNASSKLYDKDNYEKVQTGERVWVPNDLNNYYRKSVQLENDGKVIVIEEYRKDGTALLTSETSNIYNEDIHTKETWFSDGKESLSFMQDFKENKVIIRNGDILQGGIMQVPSLGSGYLDQYLEYLLFSDIYESNLGGKDCYVIRFKDIEYFVDKETGIIIKSINNKYNIAADFYYEFGITTDEDVKKPEIPTQND